MEEMFLRLGLPVRFLGLNLIRVVQSFLHQPHSNLNSEKTLLVRVTLISGESNPGDFWHKAVLEHF